MAPVPLTSFDYKQAEAVKQGMRRRLPSSARRLGLLALLLVFGCEPKATHDECSRLIDRYVELSLGPPPEDLPPGGFQAWVDQGIQRGREREAYAPRVDQCEREIRRDRLYCGLRAHTRAEWEACMN